jgi:DnaJ-class molecular chaperone
MYLECNWDEPEYKERTCKWCRGSGRVKVELNSSLEYTCPDCNGRGTYQPKVINDEV